MAKQNLQIIGVEDTKEGRPRITKTGKPYGRINTDQGWFSCFDMKVVEGLKPFIDKTAEVETSTVGEFSNIKKLYGIAAQIDVQTPVAVKPAEEVIEVVKMNKPAAKNGSSTTTFYTAYAKDIFMKMIDLEQFKDLLPKQIMEEAVVLVKEARESFE